MSTHQTGLLLNQPVLRACSEVKVNKVGVAGLSVRSQNLTSWELTVALNGMEGLLRMLKM
jgi:hypothetical protein